MRYLLDVNVLLAAIWSQHTDHHKVWTWIGTQDLALCPIAEIGFLRISTNRRAFNYAMKDARHGLEQFAINTNAAWIADDLKTLDSNPKISEEVTDHYLADLAVRHGLKLATLDEKLKHPSVELIK